MKKNSLFGIVFVLATILDQVSKIWVTKNIQRLVRYPDSDKHLSFLEKIGVSPEESESFPTEISVIDGFFSIVHTQNEGAAFGIMQGQMWIFAVFTIIALGVIIWTLRELPEDERFQNIALALLTSGTIGNGIDRMHKQSVTDLLHVYSENPKVTPILIDILGSTAWPSFNVADAAIVVGMIMFGIFYLFLEKDVEDIEEEDVDDVEQGETVDAIKGLSS
jgi:signal peptidase II